MTDRLLVDPGTVVGDLDNDGPTDAAGRDRDDCLRRLTGGRARRGVLAAVGDRVDDEVFEGVSDTVEHLLVQLDILAAQLEPDVFSRAGRDITHDAGQRREDAADRDHRQSHRAVAHERHPAAVPFDELAQAAHRGGQLVTDTDEPVQGEGDVCGQAECVASDDLAQRRDPPRLLRRQCKERARRLLDAPGTEIGLAHRIKQVIDLGGTHPHRVGGPPRVSDPPRVSGPARVGGPPRRDAVERLGRDPLKRNSRDRPDSRDSRRHGHRVLARYGPAERVDERLQRGIAKGLGSGLSREGMGDPVAGGEQEVDEVPAHREPLVPERAEQVLHRVGDAKDAVQAQHPRRALHRVGVAEEPGDDLAWRAVALEREQA